MLQEPQPSGKAKGKRWLTAGVESHLCSKPHQIIFLCCLHTEYNAKQLETPNTLAGSTQIFPREVSAHIMWDDKLVDMSSGKNPANIMECKCSNTCTELHMWCVNLEMLVLGLVNFVFGNCLPPHVGQIGTIHTRLITKPAKLMCTCHKCERYSENANVFAIYPQRSLL